MMACSPQPACPGAQDYELGRRRAASDYIRSITGCVVPHACGSAFCAALEDGTVLCQLINATFPGSVSKVLSHADVEPGPCGVARQRQHNVSSFLAAAQRVLPADRIFSLCDLEVQGNLNGPSQVVECVLALGSAAMGARAAMPPTGPSRHGAQHATPSPCSFNGVSSSPYTSHHHADSSATPAAEPVTPVQASTSATHFSTGSASRPPLRDGTPSTAGCGSSSADRYRPLARGLHALPGNDVHHQQSHELYNSKQPQQQVPSPQQLSPQPQQHFFQSPIPSPPQFHQQPLSPVHGEHSQEQPPPPQQQQQPDLVKTSSGGMSSGIAGMASMPSSLFSAGMPALSSLAMPGMGALGQRSDMRSMQAVAGVTRLMQQCSGMLKERMYMGGSTQQQQANNCNKSPAPFDPQEVLFPVLDSVLGQITQEYEKRLLNKDHELSSARERAKAAQQQLAELQSHLEQLQAEAHRDNAAMARAAAEAAAGTIEEQRTELDALRRLLQERDGELAELRGVADEGVRARLAREVLLEAQLEDARRQLAEAEGLGARYRSVVEQNRALYNEVQDLKGNIRVFCRIRPPGATGDSSASCVDISEEEDLLAVYNPARTEHKEFRVNRVFDPAANQDAVYDDTQPLVRSVLDGYNVCIFAYGQTGSGKTHTMSGTHTRSPQGRGINYRALDDLFAIRDARRGEVDYRVTVQMLEIYNESLRDLLVDSRAGQAPGRLEILNTQTSGCNVPGAVQVVVETSADVVAIMARGAANRATSETKMNDRSSRSHQILTVIVDGFSHVTGGHSHGCLHLIDLAGSERVSKSEASGDRLVEAQHINRSLSALGDVMTSLASKSSHIPFRNSKLTQVLQDSLCGQAKVMMFMHISPESNMYGESVSTLNFAKRVAEVTLGQAKRNVESGKVIRANEALAAARAVAEQKDSQLRAVQDALAVARREAAALAAGRGRLEREAREMRLQLEATRKEAAMELPGNSAASTQLPRMPSTDRTVPRDQIVHKGIARLVSEELDDGGASSSGLMDQGSCANAAGGSSGRGTMTLPTPREREPLASARSNTSSLSNGPPAAAALREAARGLVAGAGRLGSQSGADSNRSSRRASTAPTPMTALVGGVVNSDAFASKIAGTASARQSGTWGARPFPGASSGSGTGIAPLASARASRAASGRWK